MNGGHMPQVHKQYFICPFDIWDAVVQQQVTKYTLKQNCIVVRPIHTALSTVEDEATLLIAGHGVEGGQEISNGLPGVSRRALNAGGLAQLISMVWLLPVTHSKIRLPGCELSVFVRDFAMALATYHQIAVSGYVESMNFDNYDKVTGRGSPLAQVDMSEIGQGTRLFTKEQIQHAGMEWSHWYNNQGNLINKPIFAKTLTV
jgi:hypothetical protein